jgi:hypothetical protein
MQPRSGSLSVLARFQSLWSVYQPRPLQWQRVVPGVAVMRHSRSGDLKHAQRQRALVLEWSMGRPCSTVNTHRCCSLIARLRYSCAPTCTMIGPFGFLVVPLRASSRTRLQAFPSTAYQNLSCMSYSFSWLCHIVTIAAYPFVLSVGTDTR